MTWADNGELFLGSGNVIGKNEILYHMEVAHIPVEYIQVSTYLAGVGSWEISQTIGKTKHYSARDQFGIYSQTFIYS